MKLKPRSLACTSSSRAISAEAVVWSTNTAPFLMPWNAPFGPSATSRRSLSLPTQHMTKSWPSAAAFGVAALCPLYCPTHFWAFAAGRRGTATRRAPPLLLCPPPRQPPPQHPFKKKGPPPPPRTHTTPPHQRDTNQIPTPLPQP